MPVSSVLSPADLLKIAEGQTRKLTPHERRNLIVYLEESDDPRASTNTGLAALFQVDEKVIRKDRKFLMEDFAAKIGPDYALSYVAKFIKSHDSLIRKAGTGLEQSVPGSLGHQNYLKLLSDLESRRIKMLQEVGAVPKELGTLHVQEERWVATVSDDGLASVVPGDRALPPIKEAEYTVQ